MLKKEVVVEELSQIIARYFEEKAQEIKSKSGDMSPEQNFELDNAIEKIADIVIQWAEQNQEIKDARPRVSLAGKDGNVFAIIGMISERLNKCGLKDKSNEFSREALQSDSYEDVIKLSLKYVKIDEIPNK